jgi:hypothetical protein
VDASRARWSRVKEWPKWKKKRQIMRVDVPPPETHFVAPLPFPRCLLPSPWAPSRTGFALIWGRAAAVLI